MPRIDFDALNRDALSRLPDLLARWLPGGKWQGREYVVLNPRRADKRAGSFKVNSETGRWSDWAVGVGGNDAVSLLAYLRDCRPLDAARDIAAMMGGGYLTDAAPGPYKAPQTAWRTVEAPTPHKGALALWRASEAVSGTVGEGYLVRRGILCDLGPFVRFHPRVSYWWSRDRDAPAECLGEHPALLLGFVFGDDQQVRGVHRIYLDRDGRKLELADPSESGALLPAKKALGLFRGCHIPLGPTHAGHLYAGEGPEDVASFVDATGGAGLCSISAGNLQNVRLPARVERVAIVSDPDDAGRIAADKARTSYREQGAETAILMPPAGGDWNAAHVAAGREAA